MESCERVVLEASSFMANQHLGSFSEQKQAWVYSVLNENKFGHNQSKVSSAIYIRYK